MIQIFRLDGMWIISEVDEIPNQGFGEPDTVLKYPYEINGAGGWRDMTQFPPFSTDRKEIVIRSSDVLVTAEVTDDIKVQYYNKRKEETE